jgi:hypothetical protein
MKAGSMGVDERDGKILIIRARGRTADIMLTVAGVLAWSLIAVAVLCGFSGQILKIKKAQIALLGACAVGAAFNVVLFACHFRGKRTVFDPHTRTVAITRLFGRKTVISFESIARVAPLTFKTLFAAREAYCLVPAIAPIFGPKIISPLCRPGSASIENFRSQIVPEVERMLEVEKTSFKKRGENSANVPVGFKKDGTRYVKNFARNAFWGILLIAAIFATCIGALLATVRGQWVLAAAPAGIAALLLALAIWMLLGPIKSISFDTQGKNIEVSRGIFGWGGVKSYGYSSVKSFDVRGVVRGGEIASSSVYLKLDGAKKPMPVVTFAPRRKDVADGLKFLAGLLDLDPVHDIDYTFCQTVKTLFEVP